MKRRIERADRNQVGSREINEILLIRRDDKRYSPRLWTLNALTTGNESTTPAGLPRVRLWRRPANCLRRGWVLKSSRLQRSTQRSTMELFYGSLVYINEKILDVSMLFLNTCPQASVREDERSPHLTSRTHRNNAHVKSIFALIGFRSKYTANRAFNKFWEFLIMASDTLWSFFTSFLLLLLEKSVVIRSFSRVL